MKYALTLLILCGLCGGAVADSPLKPASGESDPASDPSRFLFIVEASAATRNLQEANRTALFDMLFTGLGGQMRDGDTFGVWTYNQETYAGQFPMQSWEAQNPMEVASRAALFLAGQRYAGEVRVELLAARIRAVTRAVGDVTVFILSDGSTKFKEIPYADAINTEYQQRAKERSRAKKPFVTALIARGGKVVGAYVAIAGQPLPLPDRPAAVAAVPKNPKPTVPVSPKRTITTVAPIPRPIAPAPAPETATTPPPELTRPAPIPELIPEAKTPEVTVTLTPVPVPDLTLDTPPAPARRRVFEFITRSNSSPARTESVSIETPGNTVSHPTAQTEDTNPVPAIAKSAAPVVPSHPTTNAPPVTVTTPVPANSRASISLPTPATPPIVAVPSMATATPVDSTATVSAGTRLVPTLTPLPEPPKVYESPVPPVPKPLPAAVVAMLPEALPVSAREIPEAANVEPALPLAAATVVPEVRGLSAGVQLAMGGALLVSAVFLILLMVRRVRPAPQPSLITRSMERR